MRTFVEAFRDCEIEKFYAFNDTHYPQFRAEVDDKILVCHSVVALRAAIDEELDKTEADRVRSQWDRLRMNKLVYANMGVEIPT